MKNKMNKGILILSITSISFVVIATIVVLSLLVYNGNNKDKDDINNPKVNASLEINEETNNQKNNSEDTESEKENESVTDENVESVDSDSTTTTTATTTTTTTTIGKPSIVTDVKIPVDVNTNKGTTVTTTQKQTTTTTTNKKTTTTTTKKVNTTTTTQKPVVTTTTTAQKPTDPYQQVIPLVVTPEQEALIEERIIYYINQFRVEDGVPAAKVLTGKNYQFAKLRSEQLVTNFAHDEDDIQKAAAQLQFGTYDISPEYRWDAELQDAVPTGNTFEHWKFDAQEAIGYEGVGIDDTIDRKAYRTALMFRNSKGHWAYIGSADYPYISVGVTVGKSCYSCILMSREGRDN